MKKKLSRKKAYAKFLKQEDRRKRRLFAAVEIKKHTGFAMLWCCSPRK